MDQNLLGPDLCTAIMRIGSRMGSIFDIEMADHGLTQAQFRTLLAIWQRGQVAPGHLAEELLLDRASISLLTNKMVESGWLERLPGENRRSFKLQLTPAGDAKLQSAIPPALELANRTIACLPAEQAQQLLHAVSVLENHVRGWDAGTKSYAG
jgi:DNA-binding MarR family transcriptional regulator